MSDDAERERARYEALSALVDGYRRERDDAREQLYMTKAELGRWVDRETKAARERDEARAEVERLRIALLEVQTSESAPAWFADGFHDGWKAGAEAMREACAVKVVEWLDHRWATAIWLAQLIRELPIPEEP